ncbi:MAG TPA: hypothetical protein VMV94_10180 [Phycisphaerae bacterium]|nr:hypothetical protein [Phycisphaerae bacterium]
MTPATRHVPSGNFSVFRLIVDDWSNIHGFDETLKVRGLPGTLWFLATNEWIASMPPRIFGLSWVVQTLVGYLGRYSPIPYFLFILLFHLLGSCLVARLASRFLRSLWHGFVCGAIVLLPPTSSNALFFLNNWFFVLPFQLLILQIYWICTPSDRRWLDVLRISVVTMIAELSGEQTIPLLYAGLVLFLIPAMVRGIRNRSWYGAVRLAVPMLLGLVTLAVYVLFLMRSTPQPSALPHQSPAVVFEVVRKYILEYGKLMGRMLDVTSWVFGGFSVRPGMRMIATSSLSSLILLWATFRLAPLSLRSPRMVDLWKMAGWCAACAVGAALPCLYGALTGERTSSATRYIYVAAIPTLLLVVALLSMLIKLSPFVIARTLALLLTGAIAYLGFTMTYSLQEVWRSQKVADDRAWAVVDAAMTDRIRAIVTYNLVDDRPQLAPVGMSDALSDFAANWGVSSRLWVKYGHPFIIAQDAQEVPAEGRVKLYLILCRGRDGGERRGPVRDGTVRAEISDARRLGCSCHNRLCRIRPTEAECPQKHAVRT